jgi:hypothetical protein
MRKRIAMKSRTSRLMPSLDELDQKLKALRQNTARLQRQTEALLVRVMAVREAAKLAEPKKPKRRSRKK